MNLSPFALEAHLIPVSASLAIYGSLIGGYQINRVRDFFLALVYFCPLKVTRQTIRKRSELERTLNKDESKT